MTGPGPIDTIREALALQRSIHLSGEAQTERSVTALDTALAALTEVEHQLAAGRQDEQIEADVGEHYREERDQERARAVAAETALAEANQDDTKRWKHIEATRHGRSRLPNNGPTTSQTHSATACATSTGTAAEARSWPVSVLRLTGTPTSHDTLAVYQVAAVLPLA